MKKILALLIIVSAVSSCKCKQNTLQNTSKTTTTVMKECVADAKCIQEIHTDSALLIEKEDSGRPFYKIQPQPGTTVYRYEMSQNQDQQYVDGGYREEIIFELPSDFKSGTISGKEILKTNALFGVFCYCKGKAGYYTINNATITKTEKGVSIEIPTLIEGQKVFSVQF